ncbi:CREB/ATF bZIP transcription factor-like [Periplaneta americana]|uniref:CREB/ATF bZIP transcription factor-like n=1 Tax=Periplaneta americana TaxID=6978 RepID=UPI0037E855E5
MLRKRESNFACDSKSDKTASTGREFQIMQENKHRSVNVECGTSEKRPKCSSKNAIMARNNRMKKKHFVESLQKDVARLSDENAKLRETLKCQSNVMNSLTKEVGYLKSVLANSNEIGVLLKSVTKTGLPFTSSLRENISSTILKSPDIKDDKRSLINPTADHNYVLKDNASSESSFSDNCPPTPDVDDDVGVCLHVCKKKVSLEFCATCNSNAIAAWDDIEGIK